MYKGIDTQTSRKTGVFCRRCGKLVNFVTRIDPFDMNSGACYDCVREIITKQNQKRKNTFDIKYGI